MLTVGCIFWGYLSDKIGSRLTMLVTYSGLIISASYFYSILSPAISFLTLSSYYGIMGLFVGAVVLTPIIGTRAFPPAIRFSGLSFAYNIAYAIFGGLTPIITGFWLQQSHLAPVYYVSAVAVLAILVGFLPLAYQGWQHQRAK